MNPPRSLQWQREQMIQFAPNLKYKIQCHRRCIWKGVIQPLERSDQYTVRIDYRLGRAPVVTVEYPQLQTLRGQAVPHRYPDGSLCLYAPDAREWTPADSIAQFVVPWISHWLLHYEGWQVTGIWHGGGTHETPRVPLDD